MFVMCFQSRYHTLVLTDWQKVYSFGCGAEGQLGNGEESNPSVPLPVLLPRGNYICWIRRNPNTITDGISKIIYVIFFFFYKVQMEFIPKLKLSLPEKTVHLQPALLTRYQQFTVYWAWRPPPRRINHVNSPFFNLQDINCNLDANGVSKAVQHGLEVLVDNWTSKCDAKSWKKIKQWV